MASETITPVHLAVLKEAAMASSLLVPDSLRRQFVLVGSGAMLYYGSKRPARDLDFVGTTAAHWIFLEGARSDRRFSVITHGLHVQYTATSGAGAGLTVSIDLLELGGEAVPALQCDPIDFGGLFVAAMPELWRMKARAFVVTRTDEKDDDLGDYKWLTKRMVREGVEYDPVFRRCFFASYKTDIT